MRSILTGLLALAFLVGPALAGGLSTPAEDALVGDARTGGPVLLAPAPRRDPLIVDAAREAYEAALTDLWRSEANGTCIGTLGAWHLTPHHIMAEGTVYEITAITGSPARIAVLAERLGDRIPAEFAFVPRTRRRVDVSGVVPRLNRHYLAALRRC